jgi:hypothetical protein
MTEEAAEPGGSGPSGGRERWVAAGLVAAVIAFLPFLRGVAAGSSFFFRDLSRYFIPVRLFVVEGLRRGELRFWNPYDNEGMPLTTMPIGYPLELLQMLWPTPAGITLLMALHFPLAAVAFVVLARHLGVRPVAAAGGAIAYAVGGFALSMINLYVYVHALAWAPLVVWGILRAADGGGRHLATGALLCGIAFSTTGVEMILQAVILAAALCLSRDARRLVRVAATVLLGLALAAPVYAVMGQVMQGTERAAGFPSEGVLSHSVHPVTLLQVVAGDLHGRLANVTNEWWGWDFFGNGFPYVMSLYLGAAALALAAAGLAGRRPHRGRLAAIAVLALCVCFGRWVGWMTLVEWMPASLRVFRYPVKAFFSVHLVVALLAAYGLDALCRSERRGMRVLLACGSAGAVLLLLAPTAPALLPRGTAWFFTDFFPPTVAAPAAAAAVHHILRDAALGGALVLGVAVLAGLAWKGWLPGARAAVGAATLLAVDLLRTGAGLNPTIDVRLFQVAPEMTQVLEMQKPVRVHTCDPFGSPAYWTARAARPSRHVVFTFLAMRDSLFPHFHLRHHVPSALGEDLTGLVPQGRAVRGYSCGQLEGMAERLREAAVTHVVSLEPLASPQLEPVAAFTSPALDPATVHVYALRNPRPRFALRGDGGSVRVLAERGDALALEVTAGTPADLLVRDGFGAGWSATVDGRPAPVVEHEGRHRLVAMPAGTHHLDMRYRPPGLRPGLAVAALGAAVLVVLCVRPRLAWM